MQTGGSFFNRTGHGKKVIHLRGLEKIENPRAHTSCDEMDAFALTADKVSDNQAEPAGVEIWDFGQVENIGGRGVVRIRLRFEEVLERCRG